MWNSIGIPSVPGLPKNIGDAAIKFGGALLINAQTADKPLDIPLEV